MDSSARQSSKQDKEKPYIEPNPLWKWNKDSADGGWNPRKAPVLFEPGKKSTSSNFKILQAKVAVTNSKTIPALVVRSGAGLILPQAPSTSENTVTTSASSIDESAFDNKKILGSSKVVDDIPDLVIQSGSGLMLSRKPATVDNTLSPQESSTVKSKPDTAVVLDSLNGAGGAGENVKINGQKRMDHERRSIKEAKSIN
ncbi:unnamed protein product [Sphagnum balticum]